MTARKPKLCFIFGTRPEIIKLSPVIKACEDSNIPFFVLHTGQHHSPEMDRIFIQELDLKAPKYAVKIRSRGALKQAEHIGKMLAKIEQIIIEEKPTCVITQGDTNTALAGALTANRIAMTEAFTGLSIKTAHVEAGLRSYDRSMPEEVNRFVVDHLSDYLFCPTKKEAAILRGEGVSRNKLHVTGNTIVDAVRRNAQLAKRRKAKLRQQGLLGKAYFLLTLHRQENVDVKSRFSSILSGLRKVHQQSRLPIIFPIHPRTVALLKRHNIKIPTFVEVIKPIGYLDFLCLQIHADLILTDSGGIQEESCVLKVPCVTLRDNTERPESVDVGANLVAGVTPDGILVAASVMLNRKRNWRNPFGDGKAAERIIKRVTQP